MKKISYKIITAIVLCSIVIASSISVISMLRGRSIIENEARQGLKSTAEGAALQVDKQLNHLQAQVDGFAGVVASTINMQSVKNDPAYLQQYIESIKPVAKYFAENGQINVNMYAFFNPDYSADNLVDYVSLINKDGNGFEYNTYDINVQDMKNKKDEYSWYYAPFDSKKGVWSDPYQDTVLNMALFTYTTPIIVDGNAIGVVGMDIKFDVLQKIINGIKEYDTGYGFMMNSSYNFLIHPSLTLQDNLKSLNNGAYAAVIADMDKNPSGAADFKFDNTDNIIGYSHLSNGFIIALTVPQTEILKGMNDLTFLILILIIAGALLSGVIAMYIGTRLAKPINSLSVLFKKAETGDLTVRSVTKSSDEIGQLSKAFNSMLDNFRVLILTAKELSESVASSSSEMMASSEEVSKVSDQVANAIQELAKGSTEQAQSTEKGNEIITDFIEGLNNIACDMKNSEELALKALKSVSVGRIR